MRTRMVWQHGADELRLYLPCWKTAGLAWHVTSPPLLESVGQRPETDIPSLNSLSTSFLPSAAVVDPDGRIYIRNWQGGILSGGFEKNPKPLFTEGRNQLEIQNLQEDWDHFGMLGKKGSHSSWTCGFNRRRNSWQCQLSLIYGKDECSLKFTYLFICQ